MLRNLLLFLSIITLVSCGGGGGGGSAPDANSLNDPPTPTELVALTRQNAREIAGAAQRMEYYSQPMLITDSPDGPDCPNGGSIETSQNGDVISVHYSNCNDGESITSGTVNGTVQQTGDELRTSLTFSDIQLQDLVFNQTNILSGSITMTEGVNPTKFEVQLKNQNQTLNESYETNFTETSGSNPLRVGQIKHSKYGVASFENNKVSGKNGTTVEYSVLDSSADQAPQDRIYKLLLISSENGVPENAYAFVPASKLLGSIKNQQRPPVANFSIPAFIAPNNKLDLKARNIVDEDYDFLTLHWEASNSNVAIDHPSNLVAISNMAFEGTTSYTLTVSDGQHHFKKSLDVISTHYADGKQVVFPDTIIGAKSVFPLSLKSGPNEKLIYGLGQYPNGMTISDEGVIEWAPTGTYFGDKQYFQAMVVTSRGALTIEAVTAIRPSSAANGIVLPKINTISVNNGETANFSVAPPQSLADVKYRIIEAPSGLTIDAAGNAHWNPQINNAYFSQLEYPVEIQVYSGSKIGVFTSTILVNNPHAIETSHCTPAYSNGEKFDLVKLSNATQDEILLPGLNGCIFTLAWNESKNNFSQNWVSTHTTDDSALTASITQTKFSAEDPTTFVAASNSFLYIVSANDKHIQKIKDIHPELSSEREISDIAIADVDNDGKKDVVVLFQNQGSSYLIALDSALNIKWETKLSTPQFKGLTIENLDNLSDVEIAVPTNGIYRGSDGYLKWKPAKALLFNIVKLDIDGDGDPEFASNGANGEINFFSLSKRKVVYSLPKPVNGDYLAVSAGDIDGDGIQEMITSTRTDSIKLDVWKFTNGTPAIIHTLANSPISATQFKVGDIDGDNTPDVVAMGYPAPNQTSVLAVWTPATDRVVSDEGAYVRASNLNIAPNPAKSGVMFVTSSSTKPNTYEVKSFSPNNASYENINEFYAGNDLGNETPFLYYSKNGNHKLLSWNNYRLISFDISTGMRESVILPSRESGYSVGFYPESVSELSGETRAFFSTINHLEGYDLQTGSMLAETQLKNHGEIKWIAAGQFDNDADSELISASTSMLTVLDIADGNATIKSQIDAIRQRQMYAFFTTDLSYIRLVETADINSDGKSEILVVGSTGMSNATSLSIYDAALNLQQVIQLGSISPTALAVEGDDILVAHLDLAVNTTTQNSRISAYSLQTGKKKWTSLPVIGKVPQRGLAPFTNNQGEKLLGISTNAAIYVNSQRGQP